MKIIKKFFEEPIKSPCFILIVFMFLFIFCSIVLSSLFQANTWIESHELERYQELADAFREAFLTGKYYPRWLPDLYGGYGYPTFVFYQPGYFFWYLPFSIIFLDTALAMKLSVFVLLFFSGFGTYLFAKEIVDKKTALFLGLCFILTPYISVEIFVRGALSELTGMLLTPWPLYFLVRMNREINAQLNWRLSFTGLFLSLFFIVISHPVVAMFYFPVFMICAIYYFIVTNKKQAFGTAVVIALSSGIIISSPYWYGVLNMKHLVNFEALIDGYFQAQNHTVYFKQLFTRVFEYGGSVPSSSADMMSFQLGAPFFVLAVMSFLLNWRNNFQKLVFSIYLLLILLMMNVSKYFWELDMLTRFVQFPWRLLAVIGIFQIISMSGICVISKIDHIKKYYTIILVVLFLGAYGWHSNQFYASGYLPQYSKDVVKNSFINYAVKNEFKPKTSKIQPVSPREENIFLIATNGASVETLPENSPHMIAYRVAVGVEKSELTIQQYYFPGWEVSVNEVRVPDEYLISALNENGLIKLILLPNAIYDIRATYAGVPGLALAKSIIGIWIILICVLLWKFEYFNNRILNQKICGAI